MVELSSVIIIKDKHIDKNLKRQKRFSPIANDVKLNFLQ